VWWRALGAGEFFMAEPFPGMGREGGVRRVRSAARALRKATCRRCPGRSRLLLAGLLCGFGPSFRAVGARRPSVFLLIALLGGIGPGLGTGAAASGEEGGERLPGARLEWFPLQPRQGDVIRFTLRAAEGTRVKNGKMQSTTLFFQPVADRPGRWQALGGLDAEREPGEVEILVFLEGPDRGQGGILREKLTVAGRPFAEERLTLPDSMVHLNAEALARVRREESLTSSLWPVETPERFWNGPFAVPVEGRSGSPFGLRRWINGEPRSFHTGVDVKAAEGTAVRAANSGRVALSGDFFFGGKSVFLDHGQGLYTMYFHLSGFRVRQGEAVAKGEVLGWVGQTGRASGPHLHWGVRLGTARVDPVVLIESTREFPPAGDDGEAAGAASRNRSPGGS